MRQLPGQAHIPEPKSGIEPETPIVPGWCSPKLSYIGVLDQYRVTTAIASPIYPRVRCACGYRPRGGLLVEPVTWATGQNRTDALRLTRSVLKVQQQLLRQAQYAVRPEGIEPIDLKLKRQQLYH